VRVFLQWLGGITLVAIDATLAEMRIRGHYILGDYISHVIIRPNRGRGTRSPFAFGGFARGRYDELLHGSFIRMAFDAA
jgi:hypothetical protein